MMPAEADDYLASALDIMQGSALHRDDIKWTAIRAEASRRAMGASSPAETYEAIRWALSQLLDGHSFFATPRFRLCGDYQRSIRWETTMPLDFCGPI